MGTISHSRRQHSPHRPPRVLLVFPFGSQSTREILEGIGEYGHGPGQWEFLLGSESADEEEILNRFGSDANGIICKSCNPDVWARLERVNLPIVAVMTSHDGSRFPVVRDDEDALAELALGHLRDLGLQRIGFLDYDDTPSFRARCLQQHAKSMGMAWHWFGTGTESAHKPWTADERKIADWARLLPKPIGIVTFMAVQARNLASACRLAKISVPDEIAILSVGDDLACRLAIPTLSGLDMNYRRLGWQAALTMDRLLNGLAPTKQVFLNRATRVIQRTSTDVMHTGNPWVAAALKFIRDHLEEGIKVRDVVDSVSTSRRFLDNAFRKQLGHSVHQEILRQQVMRASKLLAESDMLNADIAEACGMVDRTRLSVLFRRATGMTPSEYRAEFGMRRLYKR